MRQQVRVLFLALAIAGVCSQTEQGNILQRVSSALAGSTVFKAGKTEGICKCGDGANTPQCKEAVAGYCKDNGKTEVCRQAAIFADPNAAQTVRVGAGKKFVEHLIKECEYAFPNKTSGCDCIEDFDSIKCNHAAWEACRRGNTMCPAMHYGEAGGVASMESFAKFIEKKCGKGLAATEMTMKYEEMNETTWKKDVEAGTATSMHNITGLPAYMISSTQEQVTEMSQEPISGSRKLLSASGFVQKQVTKMVIKYTMRSMMKRQSNVVSSLTNAAANNGQGFFDTFQKNGVSARPFMSSPVINSGSWFGGPQVATPAAAAPSSGGSSSGLTGGQIAGIVIGSVFGALLLGLLALLCCLFCAKKKKKERETEVKHEYVRTSGDVETGKVAKVDSYGHHDSRVKHPNVALGDPENPIRVPEDDDVNYKDARNKKAGLAVAGIGAAGIGAAAVAGRSRDRSDSATGIDKPTNLNAGTISGPSHVSPETALDGSQGLDSNNSNRGASVDAVNGQDGMGGGSSRTHAGMAGAAGAAALGAGALAARGAADTDRTAQLGATDRNSTNAATLEPTDGAEEYGTVRDPYAKVDIPVRPDAASTTAELGATASGGVDAMTTPRRTPTVYERVVSAVQTVKDSTVGTKAEPSA